MLGTECERESRDSVLSVWLDDDCNDDDEYHIQHYRLSNAKNV